MLQQRTRKELERKYGILKNFVINSVTYPIKTIKENYSAYRLATTVLLFCLAAISIFLLIIFHRSIFQDYVFSWQGKGISREESSLTGGKQAAFYILRVSPDGALEDIREYPVSADFYKNVTQGSPVFKPSFYNGILPQGQGRDGGEASKDFLLFAAGLFLLAFGLITSNGFFALIFASLFMVEPKYGKKSKKKK
jgi:hypothetical protein